MHQSFQTLGLLGQGGRPAAGGDPEIRKAVGLLKLLKTRFSQTAPINPTEVIVC